jgi:hypothetical protein
MGKQSTRRMRRKTQIPRAPNAIHTVCKTLVSTLARPATDSGTYRSVTLSSLPGSADITSLFQYYTITKVRYDYVLINAPNNNANFPTIYFAPQHISSTGTPLSRDEVLQFNGVKEYQFGPSNLKASIVVKPKFQYDVGGVNAAVEGSGYCSNAASTVPFITIVDWISRYSAVDPTHTIDLVVRVWLRAKLTR